VGYAKSLKGYAAFLEWYALCIILGNLGHHKKCDNRDQRLSFFVPKVAVIRHQEIFNIL